MLSEKRSMKFFKRYPILPTKKLIVRLTDCHFLRKLKKKGTNFLFDFLGNCITHAPHQTNCNFKAKAKEVKSYSKFQYKIVKANLQAKKVFKP